MGFKKVSTIVTLGLAIVFIFCIPVSFGERDLVASLGQVPLLAESPEKGVFIDLIKAIDEVYPGHIQIGVYPNVRSINNVLEGKADFHMPSIRSEIPESKLPYRYVSEKLDTVTFVLYSNINKKLTRKDLEDAAKNKNNKFPYSVEGLPGIINTEIPIIQGTDIEQTLRKIQSQRVDATFRPQEQGDVIIKKLKLNQIYRSFWSVNDDAILIPKGSRGDEVDKILSDCIRKLKASGRFQEIYKGVHHPYSDWQPSQVGW